MKIKIKKKIYIEFFLILVFVLLWTSFLYFFPPEVIVSVIGIEAGYFLIFLTAIIGVSGFASTPFYGTFITLASTGEFNLLLLLLSAVPAMTLGDSIFFLIGRKGHSAVDDLSNRKISKFSRWLEKKPKWAIPTFTYLYTAVTPFPQDILMIGLGLGQANFKKVFTAVFLGNATFLTIIYLFSKFIFPDIFS